MGKCNDHITKRQAMEAVAKHNITDQITLECYDAILIEIGKIPAADVGPVVHCKDCKYRDPEDKKCDGAFTGKHGLLPMHDNDFCSYGERKFDGKENEK